MIAGARQIDLGRLRSRWVGVYILVDGDEIVYIGQSTDVDTRIAGHVKRERKMFSSAFWIEVPLDDLDPYEGALIRNFNPHYNVTAPTDAGRDDEILAKLSVPVDEAARAAFLARRNANWHTRVFAEPSGRKRRQRIPRKPQAVQKLRRDRLFAGLTAMLAARAS